MSFLFCFLYLPDTFLLLKIINSSYTRWACPIAAATLIKVYAYVFIIFLRFIWHFWNGSMEATPTLFQYQEFHSCIFVWRSMFKWPGLFHLKWSVAFMDINCVRINYRENFTGCSGQQEKIQIIIHTFMCKSFSLIFLNTSSVGL